MYPTAIILSRCSNARHYSYEYGSKRNTEYGRKQ